MSTVTDPLNLRLDNPSGGRVEAIETRHDRAMVFAGGAMTVSPADLGDAFVVACDSGYDHALAAGIAVDLLVGDMDSISDEGRQHAESSGVATDRHSVAKDATDFELGIDACVRRGIFEIAVFGGESGRIDHLLGIATALTSAHWRDVRLRWHTETGLIIPLVGPGSVALDMPVGSVVSLIAVSDCSAVSTNGLAWTLNHDRLARGTSRGLSNETTALSAAVSITDGAMLVITSPKGTAHT